MAMARRYRADAGHDAFSAVGSQLEALIANRIKGFGRYWRWRPIGARQARRGPSPLPCCAVGRELRRVLPIPENACIQSAGLRQRQVEEQTGRGLRWHHCSARKTAPSSSELATAVSAGARRAATGAGNRAGRFVAAVSVRIHRDELTGPPTDHGRTVLRWQPCLSRRAFANTKVSSRAIGPDDRHDEFFKAGDRGQSRSEHHVSGQQCGAVRPGGSGACSPGQTVA